MSKQVKQAKAKQFIPSGAIDQVAQSGLATEEEWRLSSANLTIWVLVKGSYVKDAAPIAKRFVGQPFANLIRWMGKQPGFKSERIGGWSDAQNKPCKNCEETSNSDCEGGPDNREDG